MAAWPPSTWPRTSSTAAQVARQGPAARAGRPRSAPTASSARSRSPPAQPSPHPSALRFRAVPTDSSTTSCPTSRASRCAHRLDRRAAAARRGRAADRPRGGRGAGLRPQPWHRPPRHQAGEHPALRSGHALVADFGIARAITSAGGDQLTEAGLSLGTPTYMLALLSELDARGRGRYVPAYDQAVIYAGLNQIDSALAWLQRAYEERSSWMSYLSVEPRLDPLRSDPRFTTLLRNVGLA